MLPAERKRKIVEVVGRRGAAKTSELSELFSTSAITIRQDLRELANQGLLLRTHGGAVSRDTPALEPTHQDKELLNIEAKKRIGKKAASLIRDNTTVFLAPGSTTLQMLPHLGARSNLRVLTNSLNISVELSKVPSIEILIVGGALRRVSYAMVGPLAEQCFENIFADQLFMGAHSISYQRGLTEPSLDEAKIYKLMLNISRETIVLADHTKFRTFAYAKIADLDKVDMIITDDQLDTGYVEAIRALGSDVMIV